MAKYEQRSSKVGVSSMRLFPASSGQDSPNREQNIAWPKRFHSTALQCSLEPASTCINLLQPAPTCINVPAMIQTSSVPTAIELKTQRSGWQARRTQPGNMRGIEEAGQMIQDVTRRKEWMGNDEKTCNFCHARSQNKSMCFDV